MKKYFIFFLLIYLVTTNIVYAAGITSTGFIPGQIWYSKDAIKESDTVKIYTAVWNNASSTLSAKVEFYDQNVILGTRDVVVEPLQLKEVYVSWKVTAGDHIITAKIISPSTTISGKRESMNIENNSTEASRKFVPIVIKKVDGEPATSSDVIKSELDKATSSIGDIIPDSVSNPISKNLEIVSRWREDTLAKVLSAKETTKESLKLPSTDINTTKSYTNKTNRGKINTSITVNNKDTKEDVTSKPIAYIKLFFLTILFFIFGNKIVFYGVIVLITFLIIRWIYRKIRNR